MRKVVKKFYSGILAVMIMAYMIAIPAMAAETDSETQVLSEVMEEVQDEISGEDIEELTQEESGIQEEAPDVTVQEEAQPEPSEPADEELPVFEEPVSEEPEVTDDALSDEEDQDAEDEPEEDYGIATFAVTNGFEQGSDGAWYYYANGQIDTSLNSVVKGTVNGETGWWYVIGGKVQTSFTGLADYSNSNGWWYINKGKVTFDYTGLAQNKNGWYYVKDSKVDFSYNGFETTGKVWWYVDNGKVTYNTNSVIKDTEKKINGSADWWYVVGSKVQTDFTGLANYKNANGWWYIEDGRVTFNHTGVEKNKNGWYYVTGSKVDFSYNGFSENKNGKWYLENGKVTFNKNSVIKDTTGAIGTKGTWWYVVESKVQTGYTGLANYKNENGWWYIKDGKVDFTFTGVASNKNGMYYIKDGKVDFSKNGTVTVDGNSYTVQGGKVVGSLVVYNGKTYYYDSSGNMAYGWTKIGSKYYYFDRSTGAMAMNTTVDGIKLDSSGIAQPTGDYEYKIQTMIKARNIYLSITSTSDSKSTQLKKCFDWVASLTYNRFRYVSQEKSKSPDNWICVYANDSFDKNGGDCYAQACGFAFLAKECGYTAYVCDTGSHCWVEINGYVYDPGMTVPGYYGEWYGYTKAPANPTTYVRTEV